MKRIKVPVRMRYLLSFLLLLPLGAMAESTAEAAAPASAPVSLAAILTVSLLIFVLLVLIYILYVVNVILNKVGPLGEAKKASVLSDLMRKLTGSVPVEKEEDIMTDHVYDGIRELDNNLPLWWKYMFYLTIVFAGIYIYYYHMSDGMLQEEEYHVQMVEAEKAKKEYMKLTANSIDETNAKMSDAAGVENGKAIFASNCAACHGKIGEGGVGPNLTDEYWLHGGGVQNVFKTIKYGVPQKGMISWKAQLTPKNIQDVASYIISLKGTNPPNAKEAQGEKYEEKKELANK